MVRKTISLLVCITMIMSVAVAYAGGPPAVRGQGPCGPGPAANCSYWGDAPFPGLCGGMVALPFLVVGSLLGGNTAGPCGPPPSPATGCAPPPPPPRPMAQAQPAPNMAYAPPAQSGGMLTGLGCVGVCTDLISSITGGSSLLY
jgi:hypothetical protein